MRSLIFIMCLMLCTGCITQYPPAPTLHNAHHTHSIQKNDVVLVRIYGENDLSDEYRVKQNGAISMPIPGEVKIENLTTQQASDKISKALHNEKYFIHPKISVDIIHQQPITVMGEVVKRGEYPYQNNITIYQAVALAGGYSYRADRHDITLRRINKKTHTIQYYKAQEDTPLLPGYMIEVRERYF